MAKLKIGSLKDLPEEAGKVVEVEGYTLAVFRIDGQVHVIDNACPHRLGPLGEGELDGNVVECPWHGWRFDVRTGENPDFPGAKVPCFPVTVEGDDVYVEI